MLIRSQDKKLLTEDINLYIDDDYCPYVYVIGNGKYGNIGEYSTEKKAIKVMDMVQKEYAEFSRGYGGNCSNHAVFQMPEDADVPDD